MKLGDVFYSVMQKDNCPFEKPRITKFVVEKIFSENCTHPIVATKTDKWGRHYCFKENQIYSTYEEAIPEKNEKLEKIRQWEKDRQEWNAKIFEEQRKKEELEKNKKAIECLEEIITILENDPHEIFKGCEDYYEGRTLIDAYYVEKYIEQKISELENPKKTSQNP